MEVRLSARFAYNRQLVAVLCGTIFLQIAQRNGYAGATGGWATDCAERVLPFFEKVYRQF
jgi:hypothetical protein